jgi:6,7-dimethyl-8-ribityllumazine synthase
MLVDRRKSMARYDNILELEANLDGSGMRVGVVMSRFNLDICEGLLASCTARLCQLKVKEEDITLATVPGALEIPLALQHMARTNNYDVLIALGAVVRGETYHFEIVSNESAAGITRVQLDTGLPIANGVLTVDTEHQALHRMSVKGREAAEAAVEMANLIKPFREFPSQNV